MLHAPALQRAAQSYLGELERLRRRIDGAQRNYTDGTERVNLHSIEHSQRQQRHGQGGRHQQSTAEISGDSVLVRAGAVIVEETEAHPQTQHGHHDDGDP
jgi:hypothetical protein